MSDPAAPEPPAPIPTITPWLIVRFLLRLVAGVIALAAAAGWIAWSIGEVLTDRTSWSQWLHWIPAPVGIAGAIVMLATGWFAVRRRPLATAVRATAGLAVIVSLARFAFVHHRLIVSAPDAPPGLRIMHWTIGEGATVDWDALSAVMIARDADLTIMQDASRVRPVPAVRDWKESTGAQLRRIASFTIYSRLRFLDTRTVARDGAIIIVRIELEAPQLEGGRLIVHLVNLPSDPERPRHEIASRALELLEAARGLEPLSPPDLVIGDFNMHRGSASMKRLVPGMRHAYDEAGHGYAATFHERWPLWHIDHAWIGPRLRATRYDTPFDAAWRHYPQLLWVEPTNGSSFTDFRRPASPGT